MKKTKEAVKMAAKLCAKKTRGRPKGSKNKNRKEIVKSAVVVNSAPKKRGRPRKNPEAPVVVKTQPQNSGEKRGRGRPRKNPEGLVTVKIVATSATPSGSEGQKKRGRPKKSDQIAAAREEMLQKDSVLENLTIKRGRPSKEDRVKTELDEKFEKEKELFNKTFKDEGSTYVQIPTLAELEYQKTQEIKTTEHEKIIADEIERQKEKSFRFKMTNNSVPKPNLNKHEDAFYIKHTTEGREITLLVNVGDKVLVEYPQNWRRTEVWVIDEISDNGNIRLKNWENSYYGAINFITGPTIYGLKIKKEMKKGK
jgi:hypothetical protein